MISSQPDRPTQLYRVNPPRFASTPLSGAGSARGGGRFNRVGVEALYLSFSPEVAIAEYRQTSSYLPPGTICSYTALLSPMVDLRLLARGGWDPIWQDWGMDWRQSSREDHLDPPTWDMADMAIEAGYPGIIFPSVAHAGGVNMVVFLEALRGSGTITVNDPDGSLPKNQDSW